MYPLANSRYTLAFEMIWTSGHIDPSSVSLSGISSIETIHNVSKKTFHDHTGLIVQFTKSQNIANNYLYVVIVVKMKPGKPYPANLQIYFICYGLFGFESEVPQNVYDALWNVGLGKIVMNEKIDMDDKAIIGIKEDTEDSGAVNYKQLKSHIDALELTLKAMINANESSIGLLKKILL